MADDELREQNLAAKVANLKAELDRAGSSDGVRAILDELKSMQGAPGISGSLSDTISALVTAATNKLQEEIAEENAEMMDHSTGTGKPARTAFEKAVISFMSKAEQQYFYSIDPNATYTIARIDENGNVVEGQSQRISGQELREDFVRIKFHALSPEEQEKVRREERAIEQTGTQHMADSPTQATQTPEQAREELEKLKTSLDHIEGHEAERTLEEARNGKISDREARERIRERHAHFHRAHESVDSVIREHDLVAAEEEKSSRADERQRPMADIMVRHAHDRLERAQSEMRDTLQHEVLDQVTGEKSDQKHEQSKGERFNAVHVEEHSGPTVIAAVRPARDNAPALS